MNLEHDTLKETHLDSILIKNETNDNESTLIQNHFMSSEENSKKSKRPAKGD